MSIKKVTKKIIANSFSFSSKTYENLTLFLVFLSAFSINTCYAAKAGDSYGGGTVFCVCDTLDVTKCKTEGEGSCGLIMANEDQINYDSNAKHGITWSGVYSEVLGARSEDKGRDNTDAIVKAFSKDNPNNNAAFVCRNYKDPIEGNIDWYLPAKNELAKMYLFARANNLIGKNCTGAGEDKDKVNDKVRCLIGGYDDDHKLYWSSTQVVNDNNAWAQYFGSAGQNGAYKLDDYLGVRAVRVFNNLPLPKIEEAEIKKTKDKQPKIKPKPVFADTLYGGGLVFCVSQTPDITITKCKTEGSGYYGLIVSPRDQANYHSSDKKGITWATSTVFVLDAQSEDNGKANTEAIIAMFPENNPNNNAAWACHNYRGGNYDDWYLPSIEELNKLFEFSYNSKYKLNLIGGGCFSFVRQGEKKSYWAPADSDDSRNGRLYWSSTDSENGALCQSAFWDKQKLWYGKNNIGGLGVRAIRSFDVFKDLKNQGIELESEDEINPKTFAPLKETIKPVKKVTELTTFLPREQIEKELESKLRMEIEAKFKDVLAIEIKRFRDENEAKLKKRETELIKELELFKMKGLEKEAELKLKNEIEIENKLLHDELDRKAKKEAEYIKEIEQLKKALAANLEANKFENKPTKIAESTPPSNKKTASSEKSPEDEKKIIETKATPRQSRTGEMWKKTMFNTPSKKGQITSTGGHKHNLSTSFTTPSQSIYNKFTPKRRDAMLSTMKNTEPKKDK